MIKELPYEGGFTFHVSRFTFDDPYFCRMIPFLEDLFRNQDYDKDSFFVMAGPCVVESEELVMESWLGAVSR